MPSVSDTVHFRVFVHAVPSVLRTWAHQGAWSVWDRHYLLGSRHTLKIAEGRKVSLTKHGTWAGFRVEDELLDAAFPLDWMATSLIKGLLPRGARVAGVDGRSPQAFVNSLAAPTLIQASVLKSTEVSWRNGVTVAATELTVPDWSAKGTTLAFSCDDPDRLRTVLAAHRFAGLTDCTLDDWLAAAARKTAGASRAA